ncbi:DNA mismatch repair protein MutS [Candidatus Ichthyocystis sparus]|nr:DNA mismatch repair protein MutS [Candidatus Ichthyocystis sparus]
MEKNGILLARNRLLVVIDMPVAEDSVVLSPSMQHYVSLKNDHPDAFLMYRMGDFYEFFFDDAVQCSSILGITLTARSNIPMAGIPAHQLEQYLAKLIQTGYKVAICDQVGQRKVKGKVVIDREITRIVTPGTVTDSQLLESKSDSCLLALHKKNDRLGMAWISVTQGIINVIEITYKNINDYLNIIRPAEIIISEHSNISIDPSQYLITKVDEWSFDSEHGYDRLCQHFSLTSLDCFDIGRKDISTGAAYAILCYINKTQKKVGQHINKIVKESSDKYIAIDEKTRIHLEITDSLHKKNSHTILSIFDHCVTPSGSRWVRHALHHPFSEQSLASDRHDAIDWLLKINAAHKKHYETVHSFLKSTADMERITARLSIKTIRPRELASLRDTGHVLPKLFGYINQHKDSPRLVQDMSSHFLLPDELVNLLDNVIAEEPSQCVQDGNVIRKGYDKELDHYYNLYKNAQNYIQELRDREREKTQINSLKIAYNRICGYYIEITPSHSSKVPPYYQRKQSLKNAERFTTEELMKLESEISLAQTKSIERELEIFCELLESCQVFVKELQECGRSLSLLDGLCSFAYVAHHNRYIRPEFCSEPYLEALEVRHPVVEQHVTQFVPNDVNLSSKRKFTMITGPNMGGKSTYMRQTAILVLLAYCGSFVPAKFAKVGTIDRIMTRIGSSDNLSQGQSTFMVEMSEMAKILRQATAESLLLIDEIGRGTSTYDGLSLAQAIMKHIIETNKSLCLFSTHYFELTEVISTYQNATNIHLCVDESSSDITFLHTVEDGVAQKSYGIHVARIAGIPEKVIYYAQELLTQRESGSYLTRNDMSSFNKSKDEICSNYNSVIDHIKLLSIDNITPMESLDLLKTWQEEMRKPLP